ncbi:MULTISPECIES: phage tail tape measure C-terminal domain-containing protein [Henriciella]|jgi:lambda family phage tail tape measure protein|uniref:Bacteriophage tail tape measure C-terminal domain-containing protein n=1 Tax=Henriciella pelagia TaxID=1977912 RepID=A0ABQ1J079_9PROT|nr:phage tail tape measure C-terminal domain-containing protein [Henriciella pelagia]GGB56800.1 hypothetical protein GCM10011503_01430 [Henriciella pelagia]
MDEFESNLTRAGDALSALSDGPGTTAAKLLEDAFADAGRSIEQTLARAARSGELDFSRMAQSVLADLARIAAEAALARAGVGQATQASTVNIHMPRHASSKAVGSHGELSKALAKAAALGGRYL